MKRFEYVQPATVKEAARAAAEAGTLLKAAGVDGLDLMKSYVATPDRVVNLLNVGGLRALRAGPEGVRIGALVTLARLADAAVPDALRDAAARAATPQIRNVATVAGNLCQRPRCWYFRSGHFRCRRRGGGTCYALEGENRYHALFGVKDTAVVHPSSLAPALVVLDGEVRTTKRTIAIEAFFRPPDDAAASENVLEPGEIVTEIGFAARSVATAYREVRERAAHDWPLVSAAVALDLNGETCRSARICLGQVAAAPWRAHEAERELEGKKVDGEIARKAAEAAFASARPLAQNGYKIPMGRAVLARAILAAAGREE